MSKKWTHTQAYASFGVSPRNVQWSWSARSEDGKTVVVTLWKDKLICHNGHYKYLWEKLPPRSRKNLGLEELMGNLAWARDHCDGRFSVIAAIAKDEAAYPRSIAECYPTKIVMKLASLDVDAGLFTAESVEV
jgi:hypothetical protein